MSICHLFLILLVYSRVAWTTLSRPAPVELKTAARFSESRTDSSAGSGVEDSSERNSTRRVTLFDRIISNVIHSTSNYFYHYPVVSTVAGVNPHPSLVDLPVDLLAHIIHPSSLTSEQGGLSSTDVGAFLSTSKHLNSLKSSSLSRDALFYWAFANPHLNMHVNDSALRISQSFFTCGRLGPEARTALIAYLDIDEQHPLSPAILIQECASFVMSMVKAKLIPSIQSIPQRFQIQLVYQTLSVKGAFGLLMGLFQFSQDVVKQTLIYEKQCRRIFDGLRGNLMQLQFQTSCMPNRVSAGGCLIYLRRMIVPYLLRQPGIFFSSGLFTEKNLMFNSLSFLESTFNNDIVQYRQLSKSFHSEPCTPARVQSFVERGLFINLELPVDHLEHSFVFPYLRYPPDELPILEMFLDAGFDIDRETPLSLRHVSLEFNYNIDQDEYRILWLLNRGSDINRNTRFEHNSLLQYAIMHRGVRFHPNFYQNLVDNGADVIKAIRYLRDAEHLPLVQYLVEHGRPRLNQRDVNGETLVFHLLRAGVDLPVFQYLAFRGMQLDVVRKNGWTARQYALRQDPASEVGERNRRVADWMFSRLGDQ